MSLETIRARLAAATKGRWRDDDKEPGEIYTIGWIGGYVASGPWPVARVRTDVDATLIAHAPADLAALVRVAEALDTVLRRAVVGHGLRCAVGPGTECACGLTQLQIALAALEELP